jgi:hypothetical protein
LTPAGLEKELTDADASRAAFRRRH